MKCSRKWWPRILILLASVLVAGPIIRGLVESLADALAAMLKLWAGQRAGVKPLQRKPMVMLVYGLATLSRPLIALAGSGSVALLADERGLGGNECQLINLDGFSLPMHKTGR